jgi:hypothetical protein
VAWGVCCAWCAVAWHVACAVVLRLVSGVVWCDERGVVCGVVCDVLCGLGWCGVMCGVVLCSMWCAVVWHEACAVE